MRGVTQELRHRAARAANFCGFGWRIPIRITIAALATLLLRPPLPDAIEARQSVNVAGDRFAI